MVPIFIECGAVVVDSAAYRTGWEYRRPPRHEATFLTAGRRLLEREILE
jgi:hypothetical protein